ITSGELSKRLGQDSSRAIVDCGADFGCIARLGQKARADYVVYGRALPAKPGVQLKIVVIGTANKKIYRRVQFDIPSTAKTEAIVRARFYEVFGVTPPPEAPRVTASDETKDGTDQATKDSRNKKEIPEDGSSTGAVAAIEQSVEPASPRSEVHDWLLYGGIGAAGTGLVLTVVGSVFGLKATYTESAIRDGMTQQTVVDLEDEANSAAGTANVFFGIGSAAMVLGGAYRENAGPASEIENHVELSDHRGRALDEHHPVHFLTQRLHDVNPFAHAKRAEPVNGGQVQDDVPSFDGVEELPGVEGLVDSAVEAHIRRQAAGQTPDFNSARLRHDTLYCRSINHSRPVAKRLTVRFGARGPGTLKE
ncbi:hypothetical protein ACFL6C_12700, partial [Myxococcota bacterium]